MFESAVGFAACKTFFHCFSWFRSPGGSRGRVRTVTSSGIEDFGPVPTGSGGLPLWFLSLASRALRAMFLKWRNPFDRPGQTGWKLDGDGPKHIGEKLEIGEYLVGGGEAIAYRVLAVPALYLS